MESTNALCADTRAMYMFHTVFRREFALMPTLVRSVMPGDTARLKAVAGHIEILNGVLHHHHRAEDKHLWPRLLERGSDSITPLVWVMETQHKNVDLLSAEIDKVLRVWRRSAGCEDGENLATTLAAFVLQLNDHMRLEEDRILPQVAKYVTAAEWDLMIQDAMVAIPNEVLPLILGMAMYEADREVFQDTLSKFPLEMRIGLVQMASEAFASHSERVYGTATPPRIAR
jgi:hemerythrin-like domain-containing protein